MIQPREFVVEMMGTMFLTYTGGAAVFGGNNGLG